MDESQFEEIVCTYPELIEDGLLLQGRQVQFGGKRADVLFADRHGCQLIVELKKGTVVRKDIAQLFDYEGYFLSNDGPPPRVMLVGNRVPENFRLSLEHHGVEYREIKICDLVSFLRFKKDMRLLPYVLSEEPLAKTNREAPPRVREDGDPVSPPPGTAAQRSIDETLYSLESRLSLLSNQMRALFFQFHEGIMAAAGGSSARTQKYGVTYYATQRKAFIYVSFRKASLSLTFYTGGQAISGLQKATWYSKQDGRGGRFHIQSTADIPIAIEYGRQSYSIAVREQGDP
jgi:hypothetical protein